VENSHFIASAPVRKKRFFGYSKKPAAGVGENAQSATKRTSAESADQ
jgi:hypothetical protein